MLLELSRVVLLFLTCMCVPFFTFTERVLANLTPIGGGNLRACLVNSRFTFNHTRPMYLPSLEVAAEHYDGLRYGR